jgi:predicted glycoside hydrolase/deacetylase ChbG (UPF0249 family)
MATYVKVARYARAHPDADLGLHLTLTSEWDTYRWGPVAPSDQVTSLLDRDGTMPRQVQTVIARAKLDEVERELRAQVELALAMGIRPTHLDSHMGTLFTTPGLMATYVKVARAYKLPFLGFIGTPNTGTETGVMKTDLYPDTVLIADERIPVAQWKQFYLDAVKNLKPGLTELIVHLGYNDSELKAVMTEHGAYGAAWRQRDYDVLNSAEFKQALEDNDVKLVRWRDLQKLMGPTP